MIIALFEKGGGWCSVALGIKDKIIAIFALNI